MKHGLGLNKILGTIHSYPTWAEGNKYAAGEWKRAHAPETVLSWLEKYHTWRRGQLMAVCWQASLNDATGGKALKDSNKAGLNFVVSVWFDMAAYEIFTGFTNI